MQVQKSVYLLIIILLVAVIVFFIYYSHNKLNLNVMENFSPNPTLGLESHIAISNLESNYGNLYSNLYNTTVLNENENRNNLGQKVANNYEIAKQLRDLKYSVDRSEKASNDFPIDKPIRTIKSKFNSQYISTIPYESNKYGINVNDKCLTVAGLCTNDYCLQKCEKGKYTSNSQKFTTDRINSVYDVSKIMNINPQLVSEDIQYPFNIFRSAINNKCLTISNQGVTVEPCNLQNIRQQWQISPDVNSCKLE